MNRSLMHRRGARAAFAAVSLGMTLALTGWALVRGGSVAAQNTAAKPDPLAVIADLDDIERLRILGPLNLQPEQLDKLGVALAAALTDYEKKVNALGTATFGASAAEVRDVRKQMLGGATLPRDFEERMKKLQVDFLKKRDELNTENIKRVSTDCRGVLTDKQIAVATKMERDQWEKDHPDSKNATDAQLFNLYCVDMFISNARIIPLLKEMRAAGTK